MSIRVYPSRFLAKPEPPGKAWGKRIGSAVDLDLAQRGGFALKGKWIGWDRGVTLGPNDFVLCVVAGAPDGKNGTVLVSGATGQEVRSSYVDDVLESEGAFLPEGTAGNLSNQINRFAAYCWLYYRRIAADPSAASPVAVQETSGESAADAAARKRREDFAEMRRALLGQKAVQ